MICARRPCQLRAMSSLQGDGQQQICQQGTINIIYTLELYCRPLRAMDGSRATNYHHVLNSAIQFEVLMSYWRFPTETRREKSSTIYMTDCTASLFRSFLVLILHPSPFWMFVECRYKFILCKANQLCILCRDFGTYLMHRKKFPVKSMWKLCFFF